MAPLVRTGGSRHTGLAAPPHRNIHLVCGCERKAEVDDLLVGLKEKEVQFIRNMVLNAVDNMKLLTE